MRERVKQCIFCMRRFKAAVYYKDAESFAQAVRENTDRKKEWHEKQGHVGPIVPMFGKSRKDKDGSEFHICPRCWTRIERYVFDQIIDQFVAHRREILFRRFDSVLSNKEANGK